MKDSNNQNPLENEFYKSQTFKHIKETKDAVFNEIENIVEDVTGQSPQFNTVNPPPPKVNAPQPKTYNPPPNNNYYQPRKVYTPPPKPNPPQRVQKPVQTPPPVQKPPQQQNNEKSKFMVLRVLCSIAAGLLCLEFLPSVFAINVIAAAHAAVLSSYFGTWLCSSKEKREEPKAYWAMRITSAISAGIFCFSLPFPGVVPVICGGIAATLFAYAGTFITKKIKAYKIEKSFKRSKKETEKIIKEKAKEVKKEIPKKSNTGNPELDKIIDEGYDYIEKLKIADINIEHQGISDSIVRMEKACSSIFEYIKDKPWKIPQIKKFLNYYLPTTLKLLSNYETLDKQSYKGENIQTTMFNIEGMMNTVANAFEQQLDSLFGQDALDIQADIEVFDSILQQEGLQEGINKEINIESGE